MHAHPDRRSFLHMLAAAGVLARCDRSTPSGPAPSATSPYDGKAADLLLHTERPPNLEMPARYFAHDLTPNDAMFVRWHESLLPTSIDEATFRLRVGGHVERPLELSLAELRSRFEPTSIVAVSQCAGNGRASFEPRVPGVQWGRGAMGNAKWTGARLRDVVRAAGPRAGAVEVAFSGLDHAPLESVPRFEKSLPLEAAGTEPLVAWAMNDAPLPMLNGFPLRLVVPGWYATYWVKALATITVLDRPFDGFWMQKAYRIPDTPDASESPAAPSKQTVPVRRMNVRSLLVRPEPGERLARGAMTEVQGLAWDGGSGVARVEVSTDGGATWSDARLEEDRGPYSWRRFRYAWMPRDAGRATVVARATSVAGEQQSQQTPARWNRSGYLKNDPERIDVEVA